MFKRLTSPSLYIAALLLVTFLFGLLLLPLPPEAQAKCWNNWSEAGQIARQNQLKSVRDLRANLGKKGRGQLLGVSLCQTENGYEYQLKIMDKNNQIRHHRIKAR